MSTAANKYEPYLKPAPSPASSSEPAKDEVASRLAFSSYICLTAVLLLRPSDLMGEGIPLFQMTALVCLISAFPRLTKVVTFSRMRGQPISICLLFIFVAIFTSHALTSFNLSMSAIGMNLFFKSLLLYFLGISVIDTPSRTVSFSVALTFIVLGVAALALLQYFEYIDIPSLTVLEQKKYDPETGELAIVRRLRSVGIFQDPNDLCIILTIGIMMGLFSLWNTPSMILRVSSLVSVSVCMTALLMTRSRGGFLSLVAGLGTLALKRYGKGKTILMLALLAPIAVVGFGGRQTDIDLSNKQDTAQERIQLWSYGFSALARTPIFGIGYAEYAEQMGLQAHNSFIHALTELGLFGGTFFIGVYYFIISTLIGQLRKEVFQMNDPRMAHFHTYLTAALVANMVGLLSLSRVYALSTYILPTLASAYFHLAEKETTWRSQQFTLVLFGKLLKWSALATVVMYVFVRIFVNFR